MATVYLARDLRHKRPVALKVLHPELAYALGADRFLREIEVAGPELGHPAVARTYLDSARVVLERRAAEHPGDPRLHALLGSICAELGLAAKARREAEQAVELLPVTRDPLDGVLYRANLARVLAQVGRPKAALEHLAYLLSVPSPLSAMSLRIDPVWSGLRDEPAFRRLVSGR